MIKVFCPNCKNQMDFADEIFYCYLCEKTVRLADNKRYCSLHNAIVDVTCFKLWQSVCFSCVFRNNCVAYQKGDEYEQEQGISSSGEASAED